MITLEALYYIVTIASIVCCAAYKLGYENGKMQESNCPSLVN